MNTKPYPPAFLLIDKPTGITSFGVLKKIKYFHKIKKIGHGGTLDPDASGLMVVAIGKATKKLGNFLGSDKEYIASVQFGVSTDTDDAQGKIIETQSTDILNLSLIEEQYPQFLGDIRQYPPKHSAIHIQGKRAYDLARKGVEFDVPVKNVRIDEIESLDYDKDNAVLRLRVACSGGTYIRSLARDLGKALDNCASLRALRRTRSGQFRIENAVSLDELLNAPSLLPYLLTDIDAFGE